MTGIRFGIANLANQLRRAAASGMAAFSDDLQMAWWFTIHLETAKWTSSLISYRKPSQPERWASGLRFHPGMVISSYEHPRNHQRALGLVLLFREDFHFPAIVHAASFGHDGIEFRA